MTTKAKTTKTTTKTLPEDQGGRAVPGDDASAESTIAQLSRELPRAAPTPAAVAPTTPATKIPGAGAFTFKKHSDQAGSYVFNPTAKTTETKLGLGHEGTGALFALAKLKGIDGRALCAFAELRIPEFRAAMRAYREGRQWSAFDALVAEFSEANRGA